MAKEINLLGYSEKVKNLSIPCDYAEGLITSLSDKAFDELIGAYFRFQLTGDENCYRGKEQTVWKILMSEKKNELSKNIKRV